ncbi:BQ5605_C002g01059 [Microbotryum silenes-dioicae]|uniref:ESCRT-II complex subunit VPS25 n=1 Tax=Microbotryum silenes-dioicae TaxID=796604 RepID=A0A2X0P128_9BASI|nr:BQ5605_C002g01059 [Microbotryum silenes-dioicae]
MQTQPTASSTGGSSLATKSSNGVRGSKGESLKLSLQPMTTSTGFVFPSLYSFPPFFTQQPTESTWSHQRSQWTTLILAYARHHRIFRFDISEATCTHELFNNTAIKRTCPASVGGGRCRLPHRRPPLTDPLPSLVTGRVNISMLRAIFNFMTSSGTAEYDTKPLKGQLPTGALVYWKTSDEWALAIYTWVKDKGLTNSIMTFWELTEANEVETAEFYQLHETILRKALEILARQGKCQVFRSVGEDGDGVKFA